MCLELFLNPQDTATRDKISDFSQAIPYLGRPFFHTIPIEKNSMCMDSPSLDLLDHGDHSLSEVMQGDTAFSIFGL